MKKNFCFRKAISKILEVEIALAHGALQPGDFVVFFQEGAIHFTFAPDRSKNHK